MKQQQMYPDYKRAYYDFKKEHSPEQMEAWINFNTQVFKEGAIPEKEKQLIAIAVAHVTQCPYCIRSHTQLALYKGASKREIMEAIWVATEMKAGAAYAHANIAIDEIESQQE